jgi:hypothetical protein
MDTGRAAVIVIATILGVVAASLAGFLFYAMREAGLWAYCGFLVFTALTVGCFGTVVTSVREGRGLR